MRLTTKGRYAVTAMLDLAIQQVRGPIALLDISKRQNISISYLEQLFSKLRNSGLVRSVRGRGGGYVLTRPAAEISVAHVINAVDEHLDTTRCGGECNCQCQGPCLTHDLWCALSSYIYDYLDAVSLQQIIDKHAHLDEELSTPCRAVEVDTGIKAAHKSVRSG